MHAMVSLVPVMKSHVYSAPGSVASSEYMVGTVASAAAAVGDRLRTHHTTLHQVFLLDLSFIVLSIAKLLMIVTPGRVYIDKVWMLFPSSCESNCFVCLQ